MHQQDDFVPCQVRSAFGQAQAEEASGNPAPQAGTSRAVSAKADGVWARAIDAPCPRLHLSALHSLSTDLSVFLGPFSFGERPDFLTP